MHVEVAPRFNGPPGSGQGGWSSGLAVQALGLAAAEVSLRRPPPLGRPLRVVGGEVRDGDDVVLEVRPVEGLDVAVPPAVPPDAVRDATTPWGDEHPFPTCFACGPARAPGDGLRMFARDVGDGVFAAGWVPDPEFGDPVGPPAVWAAMDCPTAAPFAALPGAAVLARYALEQRAPVRAGAPHVVGAWSLGVDGRKRRAAGVLWDAEGAVLAVCEALWVVLRAPASA